MDISICIVSFNARSELARTLTALSADCRGLSAEMIVVDNNSFDGSADYVRETFPETRLMANDENRLFTAACNQAIQQSAGEFVLLLNSDVEILPGTIGPLLDYLSAHPDVGAATVKMMFPNGRIQMNCARFLQYNYLLLEHSILGVLLPTRREAARSQRWYAGWDRLERRHVEVAPGSFLLARRSTFDVVGDLDERLMHYFSDEDWCLRLGQAGFKLVYLPLPGAIHVEGASSSKIPHQTRRLYFTDMITYARKHFGRGQALTLRLLTTPTLWGMEIVGRMRRT